MQHQGHHGAELHEHGQAGQATTKREAHSPNDAHEGHGAGDLTRRLLIAVLAALPVFLYSEMAMMIGIHLPEFTGQPYVLTLLASIAVFYGGWPFFTGSVRSIRQGVLDMNVLVALALSVGFVYSVYATVTGSAADYYEAVSTLVVFILAGHVLEARAYSRTQDAIGAVLQLIPARARRVTAAGEVEEVSTSELSVGDLIQIRPGERIAADSTVATGETTVDEAMLTGESQPVAKGIGSTLIGGSVNHTGLIAARVQRVGHDSFVAQLARLVRDAQASKPRTQRLADRMAHYLTLIAIVCGAATFVYWGWLAGRDITFALSLTTSVIIITCPHALGLAMPAVVTVATGMAAKHGLVIKDAATIEGLAGATMVVLDKTGTLTLGQLTVTDVLPVADGVEADHLVALAAAAQAGSTHGISAALAGYTSAKKVPLPRAMAFHLEPGRGVTAQIDGQAVIVGNRQHMASHAVSLDQAALLDQELAGLGKTVTFVARAGTLLGAIGLADSLRPGAGDAVEDLGRLGLKTLMVTGDNHLIASRFAGQLSMDFHAEVLPGGKSEIIKGLQATGERVVMVGDGINDAAALVAADVGVAIGGGTDIAVESADVVLVRSDPSDVAYAVRLARATLRKMRQNLFWATGYNILAIPVAAGVLYSSLGLLVPPGASALVMSASSVIVVVNALALKVQNDRPKQVAEPARGDPAERSSRR